MEAVQEVKYKGYTVTVKQDSCPCESPRDWDNLGSMVIIHPRYTLGDTHAMNHRQLLRIAESKDIVALPIFMLDHSGITISTKRFACPWDSGQVGFIFVTKEKLRQEFGYKNVTAKRATKARLNLSNEVDTYDLFIRGEVYGYEVTDKNGECVDSCWGFITNDPDTVIKEGTDYIDSNLEDDDCCDDNYCDGDY